MKINFPAPFFRPNNWFKVSNCITSRYILFWLLSPLRKAVIIVIILLTISSCFIFLISSSIIFLLLCTSLWAEYVPDSPLAVGIHSHKKEVLSKKDLISEYLMRNELISRLKILSLTHSISNSICSFFVYSLGSFSIKESETPCSFFMTFR